MKLKLPFLLCLIYLTAGRAQNLPTLVSYQIDTMCYGDYNFSVVHTIQVEDLDMDSTYLVLSSYNSTHLNSVTVHNPPYLAGQTIRTFYITADPGTGLSTGLNLSDIFVDIYGSVPNDLGFTGGVQLSGVSVYGMLGLSFDVSGLTLCSNDNPIDMRPYATPAGGTFSWDQETSYMFDPTIYMAGAGSPIYYNYTNAAGCSDYWMSYAPTIVTAPDASMSTSGSTCGNADGYATPYISGGVPPFNVYWSTGFSETVSSIPTGINNLKAGNYYMNVTDANGCKSVAIAQISDSEVDPSETYGYETCSHQSGDGFIDLSIFSSMGTVNYIYWSNGQTGTTLSNVHTGDYTVEIRTDAGCEANMTYTVPSNPGFYAQNMNSTDASCSNSDGVIDIDIFGGSGSYTYDWNNGAFTTEDLFGIPAGTYMCHIIDNVSGCYTDYEYTVQSFGGPVAYLNSTHKPTCAAADGTINMDVYSWYAPLISTSWNTGQTTADLHNVPAGTYTLTLTAQDGCVSSVTVVLENEIPQKPEICMLTVDTSLIYNMVVWEKDLSQPQLAGYNIYRETSVYGNFELVASRSYSLESFFQDNDASPIDRSWRYYLTSYDNCGNESPGSYVHKTIHVVSSTSNSIDYNVSWDNYEGLNYSSVDVFRFDSLNGWQTIGDDLPYGTNYTMDTPPVVTGLDYLVTFNLADPCTSTKVQDHNSSRSNKTASVFDAGGSTAQIADEDMGVISIYPNPFNDQLIIHVDNPEEVETYQVVDVNGNLVYSGNINSNNTTIQTDQLAAGVYFIRLVSDQKIITEKLIRQ